MYPSSFATVNWWRSRASVVCLVCGSAGNRILPMELCGPPATLLGRASISRQYVFGTEHLSPTDEQLVKGLSRGCERSFRLFYARYADQLYRYALMVSGSTSVAEDATQEVFEHVLRKPEQFDPTRQASASGWLYGVLRNSVRRSRRVDDRSVDLLERADEASSPELAAFSSQANSTLAACLGELPFDQREVLVMCCLQDLSYELAAQVLEIPVGTVRSRVNRARASLREEFEKRSGHLIEESYCESF